jgi:ribosomal protein S18 acetylase RimI-like enzyme
VESTRPASAEDIPRVVELAELMRAELAAMRGGPLWLERDAWPAPLEDAYDALLERDDALLVLGTIDDVVVGFAAVVVEQLRSGARLGVITDLFVEAEAREVGVGEVLADVLVEHCVARGCLGVDAIALPGHRAAKNFFEAHGFTARALAMHHRLDAGRIGPTP